MNLFTTVFGYTAGILLLIFALPFLMIQNILSNQKLFDGFIKSLSRIIPALFGIKVRVEGLENFRPDGTYIFAANHVNIFDGFILYGYIPNFIRGVELEDHFSWPVWGAIIKQIGIIPISHRNTREAMKSLEAAKSALHEGTSIIILPEGHRTRNGELQQFMRGASLLARNSQVEIIPVAMKNLWDRKSVHSRLVRPGTVELLFGQNQAEDSDDA